MVGRGFKNLLTNLTSASAMTKGESKKIENCIYEGVIFGNFSDSWNYGRLFPNKVHEPPLIDLSLSKNHDLLLIIDTYHPSLFSPSTQHFPHLPPNSHSKILPM